MTNMDSISQLYAPVAEVLGADAMGDTLLVCEHASNRIPEHLVNLGLSEDVRRAHVAWDPGARDLSLAMAARLDAPVVAGCVSRLVFDCNRAPDAADAIPEQSEIHAIPGNTSLSRTARAERIAHVYDVLHATIDAEIAARPGLKALLTVHSFTPVFHGERRKVEIGVLHGSDARLALAMVSAADGAAYHVALNAPYGPLDGVSHMVDRHGAAANLPSAMIEVRNDLLEDEATRLQIAGLLCDWFTEGMRTLAEGQGPR